MSILDTYLEKANNTDDDRKILRNMSDEELLDQLEGMIENQKDISQGEKDEQIKELDTWLDDPEEMIDWIIELKNKENENQKPGD